MLILKEIKKTIDPAYQTSSFSYNVQEDNYRCPQDAILQTNGREYEKIKKGRSGYLVKKYITHQCLTCLAKLLCTKCRRREIERSQYKDAVDENNKRVDDNMTLYKKRKQVIEHPFGTIKRNWGYTYTLMKGKQKVNGEMAIIFTVYNIRRAMSILGVRELISRLKAQKNNKPIPKPGNSPLFQLYRTTAYSIAA